MGTISSALAEYRARDDSLRVSNAVTNIYVLGDHIGTGDGGGRDTGTLSTLLQKLRARRDRIAWFTYRRFARLETRGGASFTSDAGWGCTVRTGQMLLAEALQRVWRAPCSGTGAPTVEAQSHLTRLARLFADEHRLAHGADPGETDLGETDLGETDPGAAPFGLRAIVERGAEVYGIPVGQWYGPATVCSVLRDLVEAQPRATRLSSDRGAAEGATDELAVLVAENGVVYASEVESLCGVAPPKPRRPLPCEDPLLRAPAPPRGADAPWRRALLLLMPLRLGLDDTIDVEYASMFQTVLSLPQSVGVIGGRGYRSVYWFAYEDDGQTDGRDGTIHALDPHTIQPALHGTEQLASMRAHRSLRMPLRSMNPSVALGFVCRSRAEYSQLERAFQTRLCPGAPIAARAQPSSATIYTGEDIEDIDDEDNEDIEDIEDTYVVVHMH